MQCAVAQGVERGVRDVVAHAPGFLVVGNGREAYFIVVGQSFGEAEVPLQSPAFRRTAAFAGVGVEGVAIGSRDG